MAVDFDAILVAANAAFGETVWYYTASTGPIALTGVFNDRYQETKLQGGEEVIGIKVILSVRAAQFAVQPVRDDQVIVRGIRYVVADPPEPDGLGDIKLTLRAATNEDAARMRLPTGS